MSVGIFFLLISTPIQLDFPPFSSFLPSVLCSRDAHVTWSPEVGTDSTTPLLSSSSPNLILAGCCGGTVYSYPFELCLYCFSRCCAHCTFFFTLKQSEIVSGSILRNQSFSFSFSSFWLCTCFLYKFRVMLKKPAAFTHRVNVLCSLHFYFNKSI